MPLPLDFYDAELRRLDVHLRAAAAVRPGDHVLDIGCGAGRTTRDAARAAVGGSALGVDLSAPMLERARRLGTDEGLRNVAFLRADAQTHAFPPARFDVGISRFGTMFFADPVAAFANIGRALRPGARLVLLVWQGRDRNEWAVEIDRALSKGRPPAPVDDGPGAFSLADPARTRRILTAAGFTEIDLGDVHEPVFYGPDGGTAFDAVLGLWVGDLLAGLDVRAAAVARERLRATLDAHDTCDGVLFDSRAWIVTAVSPSSSSPG